MGDTSKSPIVGAPKIEFYDDQEFCANLLMTITETVPLRILRSETSGAGTGLFVTEDVEYGTEIYRSEPQVMCVDDDKKALVCDHCFAFANSVLHSDGRFRRQEDPGLTMMACNGCKVTFYCSKACQKKAWRKHHKYECALLGQYTELTALTRVLYRLIEIHKHKLTSNNFRASMFKLQNNFIQHLKSANAKSIWDASEHATLVTKTTLDPIRVVDLYGMVCTRCESQKQVYLKRFPESIEQIAINQGRLVKILNGALVSDEWDDFYVNSPAIIKQAFSDGKWPEYLQPWPTLQAKQASLHEKAGCPLEALPITLRRCLTMEWRFGDVWVKTLSDLTQVLAVILTLPRKDQPYGNSGFPTEPELWDVLHGYLQEMYVISKKVYGLNAGFTKAIHKWYLESTDCENLAFFRTAVFAERFRFAQSKLLLWAGVDRHRGITLS
ncbi:hypothetical protein T440DRAFT_520728 [Plenodomus tracheiphilus IPT5]|uniref:MYND-type domain-containing protein n=1 Tax=Plenodomus tracheiphilus IPT5 TaxID=1408161 RepID=A0A6A7AZK2_9PLEO|nr:hypothetical protein T440DRAFT_520728 [Plenodomus tracheiphilus IPT5]